MAAKKAAKTGPAKKAPTVATGAKADPYAAFAHAMTHAQVLQGNAPSPVELVK